MRLRRPVMRLKSCRSHNSTCEHNGFVLSFGSDRLAYDDAHFACLRDGKTLVHLDQGNVTALTAECCKDTLKYWVHTPNRTASERCKSVRPFFEFVQNSRCATVRRYICAEPVRMGVSPAWTTARNVSFETSPAVSTKTSTVSYTTGVQSTAWTTAPPNLKILLIGGSVGGAAACFVALLIFSALCYWLGKRRTEQRFAMVGIKRSNYYNNNASSMREIEERVVEKDKSSPYYVEPNPQRLSKSSYVSINDIGGTLKERQGPSVVAKHPPAGKPVQDVPFCAKLATDAGGYMVPMPQHNVDCGFVEDAKATPRATPTPARKCFADTTDEPPRYVNL